MATVAAEYEAEPADRLGQADVDGGRKGAAEADPARVLPLNGLVGERWKRRAGR